MICQSIDIVQFFAPPPPAHVCWIASVSCVSFSSFSTGARPLPLPPPFFRNPHSVFSLPLALIMSGEAAAA